MSEKALKLKKGGLDTIIAYIVVMLPLLYVLVYIIATIYHFSVQMYMNQVVKEATVMISTYGTVTINHTQYITNKLKEVLGNDDTATVEYYVRKFNDSETTALDGTPAGVVGPITGPYTTLEAKEKLEKADIIGIYVTSSKPSILGNVSSFSLFGNSSNTNNLYYTSYREEIIRNEHPWYYKR